MGFDICLILAFDKRGKLLHGELKPQNLELKSHIGVQKYTKKEEVALCRARNILH
jgi:hypothetical protein